MRRGPFLPILLLLGGCAGDGAALPPEAKAIALASPPHATKRPHAKVVTEPPIDDSTAPSLTWFLASRDPRSKGTRSITDIQTEISALERLRSAPSPSVPTAPLLLRTLAEDRVELRKAGTVAAAQDAIETYEALVQGHPAYPKMDEVLYYLGLECELSGGVLRARRAVQAYFLLIERYPTSSFVPFAYFALGEMFLREAKADPRRRGLAQAAYSQAVRAAQPDLLPDALWRSGQVEDLAGDEASAQSFYDRLRREYPSSAAAARIGEKP